MKVLLDMPVSPSLVGFLSARGHEAIHACHVGLDRARDSEILDVARRDSRIVITADLDFPRILALSSAEGPGLTLLRGGNYSDSEMRDLLERVLEECHLIPWRPLSAWWTDDVSDAPACH